MDVMPPQHPEGFPAAIDAEVEITFRWFERLRVLFGRPLTVKHRIFCERDPGRIAKGPAEGIVTPIGGRN